jgi:hypothetical protein
MTDMEKSATVIDRHYIATGFFRTRGGAIFSGGNPFGSFRIQ